MSLTRGMIIKDGRPIMPQWMDRGRVRYFNAVPVNGTYYVAFPWTGDVRILYISVRHVSGAGRDIRCRVSSDGNVYASASINQNNNTWYYWYREPQRDDMTAGVAQVMAKIDMPWFGHSLMVEVAAWQAGVADLECVVMYEQL